MRWTPLSPNLWSAPLKAYSQGYVNIAKSNLTTSRLTNSMSWERVGEKDKMILLRGNWNGM